MQRQKQMQRQKKRESLRLLPLRGLLLVLKKCITSLQNGTSWKDFHG